MKNARARTQQHASFLAVGTRTISVAILTAVSLVLTGCTSTEQPVGPPEPEVNALSMSPRGDMMYRCLRDAGWDIVIDWDGGVI